MRKFLFVISSMLLLAACSNKPSIKALEKKVDQFNFRLTPLSPESLYASGFKGEENAQSDKEKILAEYRQYSCFMLEIDIDRFGAEITEYNNKAGEAPSQEDLLNYYLFGMQNDLKLTGHKGDEQLCAIYFFERNFALTKTNRFIVGFKRPVIDSAATLTYSNPYLGIGKVDFIITKNNLTS